MTEPTVGTVLGGKYVVEGVLGRGGMGVVVAARHVDLDQHVAIKCLLPEAMGNPEVVERFAREARAAARIQGEHVARVIDVGRFEDGTPFMVMEHLRGHDLQEELTQRGTLPVQEAVRHVFETCEALAQAHAVRIVHRDLKPSNLFLAQQPGRRPIVKVLDFGISKVVDPNSQALTRTSSVMGTPYYMSPEQLLSSKNVDERSDIWSLGVILYELLTGQPPFTGETAPEIIAKIVQNTPVPPRLARPDLPEGLEAIILKCMRTKVEERFANVAQLAAALTPFGAASDRESAIAISRVLGQTTQTLEPSRDQPDATQVSAGNAPPRPAAAPQAGPTARSPQTAPAATAHDLSVSSRAVPAPARKSWVLPVTLAGVVLGIGGAVAFVRLAPKSPPAAAAAEPVVPAAPSVQPSASLEPLPSVDTPLPSASAPAASAPAAAAAAPARAPAAPGSPTRPTKPTPSPSAAPPAPPAPSPPPPPPAPAPTATNKNPLDLPFK